MSRLDSLRKKAKLLQKSKKKAGKPIQLKEAYLIVARAAGYSSWQDMKEVVQLHEAFRPSNMTLPYWDDWYPTYQDARKNLKKKNQFLLPYENQFFICGINYIEVLGLDKDDSDLALVGNDWVYPKDEDAFQRLIVKLKDRQKNIEG